MILTKGLINETWFISKILNQKIDCKLTTENFIGLELSFSITPDSTLIVFFNGILIWKEKTQGVSENFGIESLQHIQKICESIINNDDSWKEKYPSPIKL